MFSESSDDFLVAVEEHNSEGNHKGEGSGRQEGEDDLDSLIISFRTCSAASAERKAEHTPFPAISGFASTSWSLVKQSTLNSEQVRIRMIYGEVLEINKSGKAGRRS